MAAKISLPIVEDQKRPPPRPRARRRRAFALFLIATLVLYCLYSAKYTATYVSRFAPSPPGSGPFGAPKQQHGVPPSLEKPIAAAPAAPSTHTPDDHHAAQHNLVPLEAHIMSKCPDAKDCLKELVLPAMMRVYDKVNFTLSYIGTPTENDGVECKHGPNECMGNIIELCAAHLYPDPKIYLGFTMCLTRDYKLIPQRALIEDCALEHGIEFDRLNDCAAQDDGAFGMGMLRNSVQRSTAVSAWSEPVGLCS
ncbi:Gamma interferon inducible lysosomal thiol reductase (GILT) [Microdochium nivale]|nr:Gamma interferon inducible lysosomal thiol reductase (GILT) [Microdochium nivale]